MAQYKKKPVRHLAPKPKRRPTDPEGKKTKQKSKVEPEHQPIRVIRGTKTERRNRILVTAATAVVLVLAVILVNVLLPGGILDRLANRMATIGAGSGESEFYGTTLLDSGMSDHGYFCLTDSEFCAVSLGGKKLFSDTHGYEHPILRQSVTRALLFDQNGQNFGIYRMDGLLTEGKTDDKILTGAIASDGSYALATRAAQSAATVSVFNKKGQSVYEWYSATDPVNNVALSPNGKHLAVSTLNAVGGELKARVAVFDFEKAEPIFSADYAGLVRDITATDYGFQVATADGLDTYSWKNFQKTSYHSEYELYLLRHQGKYTVTVWNRSANRQDNHIAVFSAKGETVIEMKLDTVLSDIVYRHGHIYCMGDTVISMYDQNGALMGKTDCNYGTERFVPVSSGKIAAICGSGTELLEISGTKENE